VAIQGRLVAKPVEDARDDAAPFLRLRDRRRFLAVANRLEDLLDFVVQRKAAATGFRKDYAAVVNDVELARLTGPYLGGLVEARLE
jgi:hypothetical protein